MVLDLLGGGLSLLWIVVGSFDSNLFSNKIVIILIKIIVVVFFDIYVVLIFYLGRKLFLLDDLCEYWIMNLVIVWSLWIVD